MTTAARVVNNKEATMATKKVTIAVAIRPDGYFDVARCLHPDDQEEVTFDVRQAAIGANCGVGPKVGPAVVHLVEVDLPLPITERRTGTVVRVIEPVYPVEAAPVEEPAANPASERK